MHSKTQSFRQARSTLLFVNSVFSLEHRRMRQERRKANLPEATYKERHEKRMKRHEEELQNFLFYLCRFYFMYFIYLTTHFCREYREETRSFNQRRRNKAFTELQN